MDWASIEYTSGPIRGRFDLLGKMTFSCLRALIASSRESGFFRDTRIPELHGVAYPEPSFGLYLSEQ